MLLSFIVDATNAQYIGSSAALLQIVQEFSTDSRQIVKGSCFVALVGSRVNGHDYIKEAEAKGAIAVLVSEYVDTTLPQLVVKDTIQALGQLAKAHRAQFKIPIVALTGSCGKTTVKEMIASILTCTGPVLATQGNLNTEIGVPLTLLRLQTEHKHAVIEMGARKKGDIAYLMDITSPDISLITNAGAAHVAVFGSLSQIVQAKGEIFEKLSLNGTAILNQDDKNVAYWKGILSNQRIITFGLHHSAQITGHDIVLNPWETHFVLLTDIGHIPIRLSVPGEHNIQNALAAAAVARALDIDLNDIALGLGQFASVNGRLQVKLNQNGCKIIDDTYNANPASMEAALMVLEKCLGPKIVVMGDMMELGSEAEQLHYKMGELAKTLKVDKFFGLGELTQKAVSAFGEGATHYTSKTDLIQALRPYLQSETTVLIKGSRGMRMEDIVASLIDI